MSLAVSNNTSYTTRNTAIVEKDVDISTATTFYLIGKTDNSAVGYGTDGDNQLDDIYAENAYL